MATRKIPKVVGVGQPAPPLYLLSKTRGGRHAPEQTLDTGVGEAMKGLGS